MPIGPDVTRAGNVRESRHGVDFAGRPIAYPATSQRQEIPFTKKILRFARTLPVSSLFGWECVACFYRLSPAIRVKE